MTARARARVLVVRPVFYSLCLACTQNTHEQVPRACARAFARLLAKNPVVFFGRQERARRGEISLFSARAPSSQVNRFWTTEGRHRESSDVNNTDDIQNYLARRTLRAKENQALEAGV